MNFNKFTDLDEIEDFILAKFYDLEEKATNIELSREGIYTHEEIKKHLGIL